MGADCRWTSPQGGGAGVSRCRWGYRNVANESGAAAQWSNLVELKAVFRSADYVPPFTVFDIRGNKYRLIAVVDFAEKIMVIRGFFTHREYDKGNWK